VSGFDARKGGRRESQKKGDRLNGDVRKEIQRIAEVLVKERLISRLSYQPLDLLTIVAPCVLLSSAFGSSAPRLWNISVKINQLFTQHPKDNLMILLVPQC
jgi:hypothetical protein